MLSHVAARFFPPTVSGIAPPASRGVFRIDHDEVFAQTTHAQYQPFKRGPWFGFNWRYDSGLVAGAVPCLADNCHVPVFLHFACRRAVGHDSGRQHRHDDNGRLPLTADQEYRGGVHLQRSGRHADQPVGTLVNGVYLCPASAVGSTSVEDAGGGHGK